MDAAFNFRNDIDGKYGHVHADAVGGFSYFDVIFKVSNDYYQGTINIKNIQKGKLLKDITQIKNITDSMTTRYGKKPSFASTDDASKHSIPQNTDMSSGNFSEDAQRSIPDERRALRRRLEAGQITKEQYDEGIAKLAELLSAPGNKVIYNKKERRIAKKFQQHRAFTIKRYVFL